MYSFCYSEDAIKAIKKLDAEWKNKIKKAIELCLSEPNTVHQRCNKKRIKGSKFKTCRLHVSMTYTIFYRVDEVKHVVLIVNLLGINQAHSKYSII